MTMRTNQHRLRFPLLFLAGVGLLAAAFWQWQFLFDQAYLYPVSDATARLLDLIGVPAELDAGPLSLGFCTLAFEQITFRIIHQCTGIFSLFIFLAALLAYPASLSQMGWGLLLGLPAFFAYGSLRLVVLGLMAHCNPAWVRFFHLYPMVLLSLGFSLFLWVSWVNRVRADDA